MDVLIVVDMQNDFIDGALGTTEAQNIVYKVADYIKNFEGKIIFTKDTHKKNYLETVEGAHLPVEHCIKNTDGWNLNEKIAPLYDEKSENTYLVEKETFGSLKLINHLQMIDSLTPVENIILVGLCTDICVISNALIAKAALPNAEIIVKQNLCAGVSPETHQNALDAMKVCHINIE